jgi:2-desacetyl-2-hydroxyethyl bacteriochlorophyllide A dehydrogenase
MATEQDEMRAAVFHGAGDIRIEQVELPAPGDADVLVRIGACGICGTDLTPYRVGRGDTIAPGTRIGHEFMGTVARVGRLVEGVTEGMRVVINPIAAQAIPHHADICGGFADFKCVENAALGFNLLALPDAVGDAEGALLEPMSVGRHAALVGIGGDPTIDTAVVLGGGPIGLSTLVALRSLGVADVVVADPSPLRRETALALGAAAVVDPLTEDLFAALAGRHGTTTKRRGGPATRLYVDTVAKAELLNAVVGTAARGSRLVVVGLYNQPVPVDLLQLVYREIALLGSVGYDFAADFQAGIDLIASGAIDVGRMVSHRFPLAAIGDAFATAVDPTRAVKVVVSP